MPETRPVLGNSTVDVASAFLHDTGRKKEVVFTVRSHARVVSEKGGEGIEYELF